MKWKYLRISRTREKQSSEWKLTYKFNKYSSVEQLLKELGEQGWELVSTSVITQSYNQGQFAGSLVTTYSSEEIFTFKCPNQ